MPDTDSKNPYTNQYKIQPTSHNTAAQASGVYTQMGP